TISGLHLPPNIFTSDQQKNIQSLQKLANLHPRIICFGHGSIMENRNQEFEKFVFKYSTSL
ncbi:MAG: MBL fold metallo-hydrolase, partial [Flavobacteriaceae bacterium]|nr:MBL fold metallo-hydrolase [Flavobacteriaceae bacterium]